MRNIKSYKPIEGEAFHVHTRRCRHASAEPDVMYVEKAIELGAPRIVFTDHVPIPGNFDNRMKVDELPEYIDSIRQLKEDYRDKIEVLCGLEAEYSPSFETHYRKLSEIEGLDILVIGQHFYEKPDGGFSFSDEDKTQEYIGLCEAMIQGMKTGLFQVVVHPDRAFRRRETFGEMERDLSRRIIQTAEAYGICLEKNYSSMITKKYYRPEFWEMVPSSVTVIYGIDAHSVKELEDGLTKRKQLFL